MRQDFCDARALEIMDCAERGMSKKRAAAKLGICSATIRKYVKLYNIEFHPTPGGIDREELIAAAANGLSRHDAAKLFGVSYGIIHAAAHAVGLEFVRSGTGAADSERADAMEAMYRAGKTLAEIGDLYGVSRERVRQILSKYRHMSADDGGQSVRAKIEHERRRAHREAECYQKHGCSTAQLRGLRKIGKAMRGDGYSVYQTPIGAFRNQRNNAMGRGIPWDLTLWDWWRIWQQSGKWDQRGRAGDAYVMCRFKDEGGYTIGNVYIATLRHNSSVQPNNPYRKDHPDFAKVIELKTRRQRGPKIVCSTEDCDGDHYAHGLCQRCYGRERYLAHKRAAS